MNAGRLGVFLTWEPHSKGRMVVEKVSDLLGVPIHGLDRFGLGLALDQTDDPIFREACSASIRAHRIKNGVFVLHDGKRFGMPTKGAFHTKEDGLFGGHRSRPLRVRIHR